MIRGKVDETGDALIPLVVSGEGDRSHEIEAVVDTGFKGFLTLPSSLIDDLEGTLIGLGRAVLADGNEKLFPLYEVTVEWDGQTRIVEADAADTDPLVGMAMMENYVLRIEVRSEGGVTLQRL